MVSLQPKASVQDHYLAGFFVAVAVCFLATCFTALVAFVLSLAADAVVAFFVADAFVVCVVVCLALLLAGVVCALTAVDAISKAIAGRITFFIFSCFCCK